MAEARTFKAKVVNIGVNGGDDVTIPFTITQDGSPLDITGWVFEFETYAGSKPTETAIITKTPTLTNAVQGEGAIVLVPADFANMPQGVYYYRLRQTSPSQVIRLKGNFDVD
jgi:hypothetical protein